MARRKKSSPAEDLIELVAMLPWWGGVALALLSYLLLHQVAAPPLVAPAQPEWLAKAGSGEGGGVSCGGKDAAPLRLCGF